MDIDTDGCLNDFQPSLRQGNQKFVDQAELAGDDGEQPLIPPETIARINELRRVANEFRANAGKPPFDAATMLRRSRGS